MDKTSDSARQAVITAANNMASSGLSPGCSGNISVRYEEGFLITPSAMPYDQLQPDDIVLLHKDGAADAGQRKPSSEWQFHQLIYSRFPQAQSVVHCHSQYATALACLGRPIPAFHYMVAVAGGDNIPCAPYATFGSEQLANLVVATLTNRKACLLANHGQLAYGDSIDSALELASEVENLAKVYCTALSIGEPEILNSTEMNAVLKKFDGYRQPTSNP